MTDTFESGRMPRGLPGTSTAAWAWFVLAAGLLLLVPPCWAQEIGKVTHLRGTLSSKHSDGSQTLLAVQSGVQEGDVLATAPNSYGRIKFVDQAELILRPDSEIEIEKYRFAPEQPAGNEAWLSLLKGGMRKVSGMLAKMAPDKDVLNAQDAVIGVRGTNYGVLSCRGDCSQIPTVTGEPLKDGLHVDVAEGAIFVRNAAGEITVQTGEFAYVQDAQTPPRLVPPSEGVQVTVPPAILMNAGSGRTLDVNNCDGQCAIP